MKLTGQWKRDTYGWSYCSRNGRRDYGHVVLAPYPHLPFRATLHSNPNSATYFDTERAAKRWVIGALRKHIFALQEVFV